MAKKGKVKPKVKVKSKAKSKPKAMVRLRSPLLEPSRASRGKAKGKIKAAKASKRAVKKTAKRGVKKTAKKTLELNLEKVGEVTHYFPHVKAAAVMILKDSIKVGDKIYIKGHTSDFKEKVESIQLDHAKIAEGRKGQEIGLFVKSRVRIGDSVYRI